MKLSTRFRSLVLLPALAWAGCASPSAPLPTDPARIRRDIVQVLTVQTAAWNKGNIPAYMQGYWPSDSLVFIGKKGLTYGWQPTLANYQQSYPDAAAMGQLTFSNLKVTPLEPGTAHVVGRWHLARPQAGDLQGSFLLVLRYLNGKWVIVADHSS